MKDSFLIYPIWAVALETTGQVKNCQGPTGANKLLRKGMFVPAFRKICQQFLQMHRLDKSLHLYKDYRKKLLKAYAGHKDWCSFHGFRFLISFVWIAHFPMEVL